MTRSAIELHAGSSDALLLLGHATGFCKEIWRPVVDELRRHGVGATALAWDARGHGRAPPFSSRVTWQALARDLVDLVDALSPSSPVIGVGHSMGGAILVMADLIRPGLLSGMMLIEPVIISPNYRGGKPSLALMAATRRPTFPSREYVVASYRSKPLFRRWHEDAFSGYIEGGLKPHTEGVALACLPEVESAIFEASVETVDMYERLDELVAPIKLLITEHPGELKDVMKALEGRLPNTRTSFLAGQTHMVVMERPDLVAAEIAGFVDDLAG